VHCCHAIIVLDVGVDHIKILIAQELDRLNHVPLSKVDEESLALLISNIINLVLEV
jgi:hypothetical protein